MPSLNELRNLSTLLNNSLISESRLWTREASGLTPLDLSLFVISHKHKDTYSQALREVDIVITAGIEALISGDIDKADFTDYRLPKAAFTATDLVEWLSCVSLPRRRAILFALEMKLSPREVIGLEWGTLGQYGLTPLAFELVSASPRHIKLKYVFWDYLSNGAAAPLFGLAESALEVSQGLNFGVLQSLYDNMVLVDTAADAENFLCQICAK